MQEVCGLSLRSEAIALHGKSAWLRGSVRGVNAAGYLGVILRALRNLAVRVQACLALKRRLLKAAPMTTFEEFREFTGWQRPGRDHGCKPVQIVPGLWTAHYHDIDSKEKLTAATQGAPIKLVVNSALCQCAARTGFWGPDVRVLEIDLEDDPDERKYFDAGKPNVQSKCADPSVPLKLRCAGDAKGSFTMTSRCVPRIDTRCCLLHPPPVHFA